MQMQSILVCFVFLAVALGAQVFQNGALEITDDPMELFVEFIVTYDKQYEREQVLPRYNNFKASILRVNKLNQNSPSARYGINRFSDMTPEEFRSTILMKPYLPKESTEIVDPAAATVPTYLDWRDTGKVTPVKNQEQCGSCWAFSATEAVESAWIIAGKANNESIDLGPQQIVDCDTTSDGCNGGFTSSAYNYLIQAGGEESNDSYPYRAQNGQCEFNKNLVVASISSYKMATSFYSETTMQSNLVAWGPLSVCVDASKWQDYQSGVMTHLECAFINVLDHCVQLVGYNTTSGGTPYWMVRNSWSPDWGIDGYIHLEMWHDTCGIAHDATWPIVA